MLRFLTLLMIATLLIGHGASYAASICQHHSQQEHVLARQSADGRAASAALTEEAAAREGEKSTTFGIGAAAWAADLLPPFALRAPMLVAERTLTRVGDGAALPNRSILPLLEPPSA